MGSVFTGRTGLPRRTKILLLLLVLVVAGASVVIYLRRAHDPRRRLAAGDVTTADEVAFRDEPVAWINIVGDVMVERAEEGDYDRVLALSRFMLRMLSGLSSDTDHEYGELAAWMHSPAIASTGDPQWRIQWVGEVSADSSLRMRILCRGFGPALQEPGAAQLAEAVMAELLAAVAERPDLRDDVGSLCGAVLEEGFWALSREGSTETLGELTRQVVSLDGTRTIDHVLNDHPLSLKAMEVVSRAVDAELVAAEESGDTAQVDALETWRSERLVPIVLRALDETPGGDPELWDRVDEAGTPRALVLLLDVDGALDPLPWFGLVDRLSAAGPEAQRNHLRWLRDSAMEAARAEVRGRIASVVETCRTLAPTPVEVSVAVEPDASLIVRGNSAGPVRACMEQGVRGVTIEAAEALVRPLMVPVTLSAQGQSGSESTSD